MSSTPLPLTSFVIRTKNEEDCVAKTLDIIFSQSRFDFEILIVDNESKDNTLSILGKYPISRVLKIKDKDFNYAYALNKGISYAKGLYICILSPDSYPCDRKWYESGIVHLERDKSVAAVTGPFSAPIGSTHADKLYDLNNHHLFPQDLSYVDWMTNSNSIIRKSLWTKYCFDERITSGIKAYSFNKVGCEDYDWAKEMTARGYKIVYEPNFHVYHTNGKNKVEISKKQAAFKAVCQIIDQKTRPGKSFSVLME